MQLKNVATRTPVILGNYVNAYGLVRSFAQSGVNSIVVAFKDDLASHSRFVTVHHAPNPAINEEEYVDSIMELGSQLTHGGFLICTDDATVSITARHREKLEQFYCILGSDWNVLSKCIDKKPMYEAAVKAEVKIPVTNFCAKIADIRDLADQLPYPVLIKPTVTVGFTELLKLSRRTVIADNKEHLLTLLDYIDSVGLTNRECIVQESVPGGAESLYTITAYCNQSSQIIAYSTGHKIRQNPPDAGTIISGRVVPVPELFEPSQKLVSELGFQGICNIEFKKDAVTGEYKLIEINARPGMWNYSATASGINLASIAYYDMVIEPMQPVAPNQQSLVWMMSLDDFLYPVLEWKRHGYGGYALTPFGWYKTVRGRKVDAVWNINDLGPWIYHFRHRIIEPIKNKIAARLSPSRSFDKGAAS